MPLTPEELQNSWTRYKANRDPGSRDRIIDHYSYLVKITAGRLVTSVPGGLEREDLISAGVIGLIKSVDQYDPDRLVKFETYAIALIRGAILELLRDEDWVPRSIREKLKALDRAMNKLESEFGRPATDRELAEYLELSEQEINQLLVRLGRTNVFSLDDVMGGNDDGDHIPFIEMIRDEEAETGEEVHGREMRRVLSEGVDMLPDRERLVVSLYYFEGLTFKEIGKVLSVSESRVYQLHTQAMGRLRGFMQEQGAAHVA